MLLAPSRRHRLGKQSAMRASGDELMICARCVGNEHFSQWIRDTGEPGACGFAPKHGDTNEVVTIETFAELVDVYFRETYQAAPEEAYVTEDSDNVQYR